MSALGVNSKQSTVLIIVAILVGAFFLQDRYISLNLTSVVFVIVAVVLILYVTAD